MIITINGLEGKYAKLARNKGADVHKCLDGMYSAEFSGWVLDCTPNTIIIYKDIFSERLMFGRNDFASVEIV